MQVIQKEFSAASCILVLRTKGELFKVAGYGAGIRTFGLWEAKSFRGKISYYNICSVVASLT